MFAYGRNMYSLSRAGYYPRWLSLTGKSKTPWVALVVGAVRNAVRQMGSAARYAYKKNRICHGRLRNPDC